MDDSLATTTETDVLIVGAGLAGSVAGYLLARGGRRVLAMELRDARRKDKLCAGLFREEARDLLREIFGPERVDALAIHHIESWTSCALDVNLTEPTLLCSMRRKQLDDFCLERYLAAGGSIMDRMRLDRIDAQGKRAVFRDLRTGRDVEVAYQVIVGADGAGSAVRRLLAEKRQRTYPALEGSVPLFREDMVMEHSLGQPGYCWYMPRGDDATVGVVIMDPNATGAACREWLASFCTNRLGIEQPELRGAPIPSMGEVQLRVGEDAYLLGDAAGLITILAGGIDNAIFSGMALAGWLLGGQPYEQAIASITEASSRDADDVENTYNRTFLSIVVECAKRGGFFPG